jgi:ParB-like chromosome segregation protein Spo0J
MQFRDRVRELRRVPARQLRAHPKNWRTHPPRQREILRTVLAEVGYADALLARELPDGTLELIDGHLRAEITPDTDVPVLVLDLSAEEAYMLVAVLDPLAAMAEADDERLASLIADIETADEAIRRMLDELFANASRCQRDFSAAGKQPKSVTVPESFQILVDCRDESDQRTLYERLTAEGYRCRVLTI